MTEIKVIIEDNALPIVQAALDDYNDFLLRATQPQITLDEFINKTVVDHFNISQESIAASDRAAEREKIIGKIDAVKIETLAEIDKAIDAVISKAP